jgi:hypothetical protein
MSWGTYDPYPSDEPKRSVVAFLCLVVIIGLALFTIMA